MNSPFTYAATQLRGASYIVRPVDCLGTCGWIDGKPWTAQYVNAANEARALVKAARVRAQFVVA